MVGDRERKKLEAGHLIDFLLQDFLTTNDDELCVSVGEILQVKTTQTDIILTTFLILRTFKEELKQTFKISFFGCQAKSNANHEYISNLLKTSVFMQSS